MNILQTIAVYVGIPALIIGVLGALTLLPGRAGERTRTSLADDWDRAPQLWAGDTPVTIPDADALAGTSTGGARGTW